MTRLILTFETLFKVLAADKLLRTKVSCRPTPTPAGLSSSICGMSLELLDAAQHEVALSSLRNAGLEPSGIHEIP